MKNKIINMFTMCLENKKSSRRLAIDWWNRMTEVDQKELMVGQFKDRKRFSLTGREIEIMLKTLK